MFLYGASGHSKVIKDILSLSGVEVSAFVDDDTSKNEFRELPVLHEPLGCFPLILAIGDSRVRYNLAKKLLPLKPQYGVAIHPSAIISPSAKIGEGTVVMPGVVINADVTIGRHCVINTGAVVDHECVIGDFVNICPRSTLCGNVRVGDGTNICAGSVVIQGITIGRWSMVGAGAICRHNVGDGVVVVDNDCHEIKKIEILE